MNFSNLLITGGSGLLGKEMKKIIPEACYVSSQNFNVTDIDQMCNFIEEKKIETILHAAAYTSPPQIDKNPMLALDVNIIGTANIVKLCMKNKIKLVYISTDYIFKGDKGMYKEEDPVFPINKYAWSKLGGESAVRLYDNSLIIRTSFGENEFPYEKAFIDQWTSRLPVKEIVQHLVDLLDLDVYGTVHVCGKRKTVFEYAQMISPDKSIGELSLDDVSFIAPKDTSLDTTKYNELINQKQHVNRRKT